LLVNHFMVSRGAWIHNWLLDNDPLVENDDLLLSSFHNPTPEAKAGLSL